MFEHIQHHLSTDGFMPHGHCYLWKPGLVWLHVVSDALVALAYTSIPFTLVYFARKRRDVPFNWIFLCFGVFIIACGATHWMEIWTLWVPSYWLSGIIKAVTAAASVPTAILLVRLMPKALAMPTRAQLAAAHDELRRAHEVLETRVQERTAELTRKNAELAREIADRKSAQDALDRSEAHKTAVMEAALDAIVLMDHHGMITDFNASAESTFGYARAEVVGRPLADVIIPPAMRERHTRGLEDYLRTGEAHVLGKRLELSAQRSDGTVFPAEVAVVRIQHEGTPVFTGYIRDITVRKQAAEAELLRREKKAAEEANAELESFSYSVAHDLRAPLRAINGFSTTLLEDYADKLDDAGRNHLGRIGAAAERMAHLIDALLALARLTRSEARRDKVDLTRLARAVIEQIQNTEPSRKVEFVIAEGLAAEGDADLLRALLENLLGNAVKFTSKRELARIEFAGEVVDGVYTYHVRDNGAGFDMAHVGKLFTPFRRLHSNAEFEGTGVGLATVHRIVRRHGGQIWAEGIEGQGATFRFTLTSKNDSRGHQWSPTT